MPKLGRTTPCAECPWLRKSQRGWLGDDEPVHFYKQSVPREDLMPCHMSIDYDDPDWKQTQLPDADLCAGNLIYLRNHMKMPRRPELIGPWRAVSPSPHVFAWPQEFMQHHMRGATDEEIARAVLDASYPGGDE